MAYFVKIASNVQVKLHRET